MNPKALSISDLEEILVKKFKKLEKIEYEKRCIIQLDENEPPFKRIRDSEKAKAEGNRLYGEKNLTFTQLYNILILYNKSIAFAPNESEELALAYANKSAVLLRMQKYEECALEIDRALKTTESMTLKIKLLCRKAECLTALGSPDSRSCLEKARFIFNKLEDTVKMEQNVSIYIEKAQSALDKNKLNIPKEDKRITQALGMIEEAEKRDLSESIRVEYSAIYGRHLVAARNYKPGEIILVEKPYLNSLHESKTYEYCGYCLAHLWTAVPCDDCARHVYCSEDCKALAWNEYHEMDCIALAFMTSSFKYQWNGLVPFLVSFFCKALKEAGSIEQLVADFKSLHQGKDQNCNNASLNFMSYKSIFTISTSIKRTILTKFSDTSIIALMGLAKFTKILGKTYYFADMKKIAKSKSAIEIGAVLLKFSILLSRGFCQVPLIDPNGKSEQAKGSEENHDETSTMVLSSFSPSVPMLMLHTVNGCISNVGRYATHGNKFILYAIQPIKAGDQLIEYRSKSGSILFMGRKSERQIKHSIIYGCPCECRACIEDWPDIYENPEQLRTV